MARQRGAKRVSRHAQKETVQVVRGLDQPDEMRLTMLRMARRIQDLAPKEAGSEKPKTERSRGLNRPVSVIRCSLR